MEFTWGLQKNSKSLDDLLYKDWQEAKEKNELDFNRTLTQEEQIELLSEVLKK